MSRRRRAILLLGLSLLLGGLAASHVGRREAALRAQLGPIEDVVVAQRALPVGRRLKLADLGVRRIPARYASAGAHVFATELVGRRLAVPVPRGGTVTAALLVAGGEEGPRPLRSGERAVDVLATGSAEAVVAGARVDVVITREGSGRARGWTRLALEDVEVLAAQAPSEASRDAPGPRVQATLRVSAEQAVYLAAAGSFARDVRLLARAPGDHRRVGALPVDDGL